MRRRKSTAQAARTNTLTLLAFFYAPLTFVTGLFGMNIRGLSVPLPGLWKFGATLAGMFVLTLVIFTSYLSWPRRLLSDFLSK